MDVLANDTNKFMMILGIATMGLFAVLSRMIDKIKGSFKPYLKGTIIYSLIAILFFALIALTAHPSFFTDPMQFFIFSQSYFLLFGLVHYQLMHRFLRWTNNEKSFWPEVLFSLILCMPGSICFMLVTRYVSYDGLAALMPASCYVFIIPLFFYQSFKKAIAIPPKIVRLWEYPYNQQIPDPEESKLKNLLVISFEFAKQNSDAHFTNFRAKAPVDMEFGMLFYYFINDYNERHPHSKIDINSGDGTVQGWVFYKKPQWSSLFIHYIEPSKTIFANKIKENDVIICSRSFNKTEL